MATSPLTSHRETAAPPRIRGLWWKVGTGLWMSLAIFAALVLVGPARGFTLGGHGAKLFLFHMPCAWLTCLGYLVAAWYAVRYLFLDGGARADAEDDFKCADAMELGLLFSIHTTVTGSIFSRNEWGAYWNWDPRQTSILVIMLIFAAYLVLRGAVADPVTRARLCSVYALVAIVPGMFLIWVLPRIVPTLHEGANKAVLGGQISGSYRLVLYLLVMPAFLALFTWLFQLRLRVMKIERRDT